MVTITELLAAVAEDMENTGKNYEDVEAAVCSIRHNIRENNKDYSVPDERRDVRKHPCSHNYT